MKTSACWGHTLELAKTGSSVNWANASRVQYVIMPTRDFERNGMPCRDYDARVVDSGKSKGFKGMASRADDGDWRLI